MSLPFPSARGERLPWRSLPPAIAAAVEAEFGSPIAGATTQPEGFSPAIAARVVLTDSRRLFLKAAGPNPNPEAPAIYRSEARVAAELPTSVPAPRLLWSYDDGEWVALAFDDIEGATPALPWRVDQLTRVLAALSDLREALTPAPVSVPTVQARLGPVQFRGWRHALDAGEPAREQIARVAPWAAHHLDRLATLEGLWEEAAGGASLVHGDIRADNLLLTDDRVVFVDWPWASLGAEWLDLLFFLPSVAMQGGPDPWLLFDVHPLGRKAPDEATDSVLAALAGFFIWGSCQPPPPGLPTLRSFQEGQGLAAVAWLRHRTRWR
jgi:aminoglycoside phosphotransferase (APT) family kinase protein